ncbi:MAG: DUF2267 domain-containing protein [Cognatishimia sp.]
MPMPWTYRHSHREWRAFLDDVMSQMSPQTDNTTYTAIQGVLLVFRRRLTPQQALKFATVLPTVPRAIFVEDWNVDDPILPFCDRETLTAEVKSLRPHHNLTPDNAIEATAYALWRSVQHRDLNRVLQYLGPDAESYWKVNVSDPQELAQRIV